MDKEKRKHYVLALNELNTKDWEEILAFSESIKLKHRNKKYYKCIIEGFFLWLITHDKFFVANQAELDKQKEKQGMH